MASAMVASGQLDAIGAWPKWQVAIARTRWSERIALAGLVVITLIALLAPLVAPYNPQLPVGNPFQAPGGHYLLGTDDVGRDLFSRILVGVRLTWFPALTVVAVGVLIGSTIGLVSGAYGGWVDRILQRTTDLFLVMPSAVVAIAVIAAIGPGLLNTIIAISVFWWPWYSRLVRGEITAIAARPHVEAAHLAGAHWWRLLVRYQLPGALPTVVVTATLDIANVILVVSMFSFLGLGAPAPAPELGATTAGYLTFLTSDWWLPLFPAIAISLMAYCSNVAGDGLRAMLEGV
jgi:peptide/nickel transport system permease protein